MPAPDYALVGRWIGHMPAGRFRHERIDASAPIRGERAIGWTAHYVIGIGFAALLYAAVGPAWLGNPAPVPAIVLGLASVAAPFFVMQPAMGAGFLASRTPRPSIARLQSLALHAAFGVGLYVAARLASRSAVLI
jgi:hypothetical protein